jgi:hypothetical protein
MTDHTDEWCASDQPVDPEQDRRQLLGPQVANALCHTGWAPLILTGMLRDVMTRHFSQADFIEMPDLRKLIWNEAQTTRILIESVTRWRGDLTEKRPAILIARNAYKNRRLGIADKIGVDEEGNVNYTTFWVGSHTLFCIHGTGASADILATEVQRELTQFAPVFTEMIGLHKFQVTQVGKIGKLEEATENFVVPVTLGWAYEETWSIELEALRLMGFDIQFNLDC